MPACHLYLDESGNFKAGERSFIGGLWAEAEITAEEARAFWAELLGEPLRGTFHAKDYAGDRDRLLVRAVEAWQRRGWRAVVFDHVSQQTVVDNPTTYVHVFAEGITKFARMRTAGRKEPLQLKLLAANRVVPREDQPDYVDRMAPGLYVSRLEERVDLEKIRVPAPPVGGQWDWSLSFASATSDPRLMMADLFCNGWYGLSKRHEGTRRAVTEFLGTEVHQALRADDVERIRLHLERGEPSLALLDLFAHLSLSRQQPVWLQKCQDQVMAHLAGLSAQARDAALEAALDAIFRELEGRRNLSEAERMIEVWRQKILAPLRQACSPDEARRLAWAEVEALGHALAACNHQGALGRAEQHLQLLAPLRPLMAARFERLPLALNIRIMEAVHRMNAYDFVPARDSMRHLADTLFDLLGLMGELEPVEGSEAGAVRSDLLGRALGTGLQAAFMAARRDPGGFEEARALSVRALREFERSDDLGRQLGYRAQLETDAGDLAEALSHLARSIGLPAEARPADIAMRALGAPFTAMHLARLWEAATRLGDLELARELQGAWQGSGLDRDPCWQEPAQHPAHVVLWKVGTALGRSGQIVKGRSLLDRSIKACEATTAHATIRTIGLAVQCDRMGLILRSQDAGMLRQAQETLRATMKAVFHAGQPESLRSYFAHWPQRVEELIQGRAEPKQWSELAWEVPY